ncbi:MAG: glycosyltransferase family 4 protein [Deltaproteobacteria bacterium]|uniref:Glycosyltransferase family 4 protein n=1 Tax=Candidatus Zymogenus saltonus TaxID=2844893 RepID=A0A9D8PPX0_9DELT|nr:glycosyltransferase family 4 protein [Candidatus Zymogenus saltonus]
MRHVLFLSYNFPPMGGGGVQRTVKFVKYLPEFGWEGLVIAADDKNYWARDETLHEDIPESTIVRRSSPLRPGFFISALERITSRGFAQGLMENVFIPDDKIFWALSILFGALRMVKKHDIRLIYSTSPPHSTHLAALLLKRITRLPWVSDFRDPWTKNYLYKPSNGWIESINRMMERAVMRDADRTICITERAKESYGELPWVDPDRLVTIYNGYDPDDFGGDGAREVDSDKLIITHSGSIYGGNYPKDFFLAVRRILREEPSLRERLLFRFVGVMDKEIEAEIRSFLGDNVQFLGYLTHREAVDVVTRSDCNLVVVTADEKASYHVTGKLFEYMAAGRPILAVVPPGEAADLVRSTETGIVISEDNPEALRRKFRGAIEEIAEMKGKGTFSPNIEAVRRFERRRQAERLAGIFDQLTAETGKR